MNDFKRLMRLTGFAATLAAGIAMCAAINGAGARDHGGENSGRASSPSRTESHATVTAKPAATGTTPAERPAPNTKHAAVTKPGHDDDDHHEHHHHHRRWASLWFNTWIEQQAYCDCRYQTCRKSIRCVAICSTSGLCPIRRPVVIAPEASPVYLGGDD